MTHIWICMWCLGRVQARPSEKEHVGKVVRMVTRAGGDPTPRMASESPAAKRHGAADPDALALVHVGGASATAAAKEAAVWRDDWAKELEDPHSYMPVQKQCLSSPQGEAGSFGAAPFKIQREVSGKFLGNFAQISAGRCVGVSVKIK